MILFAGVFPIAATIVILSSGRCSKILMTTEILEHLKSLCGATVPHDYLQFLAAYPDSLRSATRALDDSDSEGMVSDVELIADLLSVLQINLEARADSVPEPDGLEFFWPDQFLVIGETGSGDYYCIDVEGEVEGVMQYDHQNVGFEVVADSLDEFVEMLVETFILEGGPADDDEEDQEEETND